MEELQLALTPARVDQRNFGLWINNWQIGQTLNALVTNQLPSGDLVLRVAGQQITATADIPIQQGARLLLEVKQLEPFPTLRVLSPTVSTPAANVGGTLQLLPVAGGNLASAPLGSVMQTLQSAVAGLALPPAVTESLGQLLRQLSRPEQLTQPQSLAQALRESGVFLESGLQAATPERPPALASDLKAGLFRALAQVDAALAQVQALAMNAADAEALVTMKRELEAGLGRITLQQLNSHPGDSPAPRSYQFELPVQIAAEVHSLRILLDREPHREDSGTAGDPHVQEDPWRIKLQLAPPALGPVEISFRLRGDVIDLRLAAERAAVRSLIDATVPELDRALASRGLRLQTTSAVALTPVPAEQAPAPGSGTSLDVRA